MSLSSGARLGHDDVAALIRKGGIPLLVAGGQPRRRARPKPRVASSFYSRSTKGDALICAQETIRKGERHHLPDGLVYDQGSSRAHPPIVRPGTASIRSTPAARCALRLAPRRRPRGLDQQPAHARIARLGNVPPAVTVRGAVFTGHEAEIAFDLMGPSGGRTAASSYLPDAFAADPDRLARFQLFTELEHLVPSEE